jgi:hypothetical protein
MAEPLIAVGVRGNGSFCPAVWLGCITPSESKGSPPVRQTGGARQPSSGEASAFPEVTAGHPKLVFPIRPISTMLARQCRFA